MAKNDIVKSTEEMMAPVRALNELALEHATRVIDMQLSLARKYADMGLASFKAVTTVTDADSAKTYLADQTEAVRKSSESVMADAKAFGQLNVEYVTEAQKIVKEGLGKLPKLAA